MKTKNKIGGLLVLGGIAFIGLYWFKKNKPSIASNQLKGLDNLLNSLKNQGDDNFIKGIEPPKYFELSLISPKESQAINYNTNMAVNCGIPFLAQQSGIDCTEYCKANPKNCNR